MSTITNGLPSCVELDHSADSWEQVGRHRLDAQNVCRISRFFLDELCLLSRKVEHLLVKTNKLTEDAEKTSHQVNIQKTEMIKIPNQKQPPNFINEKDLKKVISYTYLTWVALFPLQALRIRLFEAAKISKAK